MRVRHWPPWFLSMPAHAGPCQALTTWREWRPYRTPTGRDHPQSSSIRLLLPSSWHCVLVHSSLLLCRTNSSTAPVTALEQGREGNSESLQLRANHRYDAISRATPCPTQKSNQCRPAQQAASPYRPVCRPVAAVTSLRIWAEFEHNDTAR